MSRAKPDDLRAMIAALEQTGLTRSEIAGLVNWHAGKLSVYMAEPNRDLSWHTGNALRELWRMRCRGESQFGLMLRDLEAKGHDLKAVSAMTGLTYIGLWQNRNYAIGNPLWRTGESIRLAWESVCVDREPARAEAG